MCLFDSNYPFISRSRPPPRGLVGLVFSFSSEPRGLRFTVDYSLDFYFLFVSGFSGYPVQYSTFLGSGLLSSERC